jgi:hypothetical protein
MNFKHIKSIVQVIAVITLIVLLAGLAPGAVRAAGGTAVVIDVISSTTTGSYNAGDAIHISVVFDEAVNVTGIPSLCLETGTVDQCVTYTGGSGTSILTFTDYVIQAGDTSAHLDYVNTASLTLPGGATIKAIAAPSLATLTLPALGTSSLYAKAFVIDTTSPTIGVGAPSVTTAAAGPVTFTVTYADTNFSSSTLAAGNITLNTTGTANGIVSVDAGTGSSRTVTVSSITGDGTLGISIAAGTGSDTAGNTALAPSASATFLVDNTSPTVSIGAPNVASTAVGPVTFTITYADTNFNSSTLTTGNITLNTTGTANGTVNVDVGTGSTRTVTISGITGDGTLGISLAAGTASDTAGNTALAPSASATFLVDNTKPTVSIGAPSVASTALGPVTFIVTYADTNFISSTLTAGNITLNTTGTANGIVGVDAGTGSTRTVTISSITGTGTLGISIAAGTAGDIVGNTALASAASTTFIVDNSAKNITAFSFASPAVIGAIAGTNISAAVPFGTDVTALVASFTTTGASVAVGATAQVSGTTPNNFTSPVVYTVTAADASTQTYTVTVTVAPNPAKAITAFSFASLSASGVINESSHTISVTVPFGTNRNGLVATFTTTGASVAVGGTAQTSGVTVNNFITPVTYTVTAVDSSIQTYSVTVTVAANPAKDITAFSFTSPAATGVIIGTNIALTVPFGTNVTTLVANFTTSGESVAVGGSTQVSGTTPNNFTSPVTYTVTAADSSTQTYTVTVTVAANPAKAITSFSFASLPAIGSVTEPTHTIAVTVPFGTDVTALVATFTTTGASVAVGATVQVSGTTPNNFTSPVTYTVTAADATTQTYTVTVTVAASPTKAITAFSFASLPATGTIDEPSHTILVTVPYGTNRNGLVATFTTTGISVKVGATTQTSGITSNNFTSPVTYTVTAADATTQTYTVTVAVAANPAKAITAFSFASLPATGVINESAHTISVTVPFGTNVAALVATFSISGEATVAVGATPQVSGTTANNFTSPVTYTVTAADSSTQTYTVTVTTNPANKDITAFSFASPAATGVITGTNISITVPFGTNVTALVATFTTTGASVSVGSTAQVSGTTPNNFTSPVTYTVTAADASTQTYTVTVTFAANPAKAITAFSFASLPATGVINESSHTISVTVPFGTSVTALVATFTTTGSSVTVGSTPQVSGTTANNFTSPVTYTVTAADASTQAYTVTVTFAASSAKDITDFRFAAQTAVGMISDTNIAVIVPLGTDVSALVANFTTTGTSVKVGATAQVSGTTTNNFTSPVVYTVTATDTSTKNYTVTVTVAPSSEKDITAFSFTNPAMTGTISGTNIAVSVPFETDVTALVANFITTGASVKVGTTAQVSGTTNNNFTSPVIYTVTAADSSTKAYTVTVTVAANPENKDITAFSFKDPAVTGMISGTNIAVTVPFGTNASALVANFITTGSSVKNGDTEQVSGVTANNFTYTVRRPIIYTVTAEDGTTKDYTVVVTIAAKPARNILAFGFTDPAIVGVISGTNIAVKVPYGTNVSALTANFITTGIAVKVGPTSQVSGITVNNFTKPVAYTVYAADRSVKTYTVTVTVVAKDITAFGFKAPLVMGVISGTDISVTVPFGTKLNALVAKFTTTGAFVKVGATVQISGKTANNFTNPVTYSVYAADKSIKTYTVKVTVARNIVTEKFRSTGFGDGWVLESNEYSNVGGFSDPSSQIRIGDDAEDRQYRALLHFPTYYLPDNAVITKAVLMIQPKEVVGTDPFSTHGSISIDITKGLFLNANLFSLQPLPTQIFQAPADMYAAGTIQNNPDNGWYWAMLDSKALSYVNLIGGTQIRLGFQLDDNDDLGADYINFYSGDSVPQSNRPYLQIDYYVP